MLQRWHELQWSSGIHTLGTKWTHLVAPLCPVDISVECSIALHILNKLKNTLCCKKIANCMILYTEFVLDSAEPMLPYIKIRYKSNIYYNTDLLGRPKNHHERLHNPSSFIAALFYEWKLEQNNVLTG